MVDATKTLQETGDNPHEECPHCKFIAKIFDEPHPIESNREYWRMTEVFVHLHGKDSCDWEKENKMEESKVREYPGYEIHEYTNTEGNKVWFSGTILDINLFCTVSEYNGFLTDV